MIKAAWRALTSPAGGAILGILGLAPCVRLVVASLLSQADFPPRR